MNVEVAAAAKEQQTRRSWMRSSRYDSNGKRTNRLVDRMRAELNERRKATLREMVKINPCKAKLIEQGWPGRFPHRQKCTFPQRTFRLRLLV